MQRKSLLPLAIEILGIFLAAGCGFHLINPGQKTVYVEYFHNLTLQPAIEQFLMKNLKKELVESPGFMPVSRKKDADIIIRGRIERFSRNPEFVSGSDQILMASYSAAVVFEIEKDGMIKNYRIDRTYFLQLATSLKTDELLDMLCKKISKDIYFELVQSDER